MNRFFPRFATGLLFACSIHSAFASDCSSILYDFSYYYSGDTVAQDRIASNNPECFGGGGATSTIQINATAFSQASSISRALGSRLSVSSGGPFASIDPSIKGLAAGGTAQGINVWANIDQNDTDFSYTAPNLNKTRGNSDVQTTVIGIDYVASQLPEIVFGLSLAFDNGNAWGRNGPAAKNKNDTDGYIIAPYIGYQLNKLWSVDASFGVGQGDFSATGGVKTQADRLFAAVNLNYARWVGDWQFSGKAGFLHGSEDYDNTKVNGVRFANTDVKNKLDQIRLGAQAGYWMNGFMPYAGLSYSNNTHRASQAGDDPLGRSTFIATLGMNFFSLSSKVTGGVFYEQELNRSHSDNQIIAANLNVRF